MEKNIEKEAGNSSTDNTNNNANSTNVHNNGKKVENKKGYGFKPVPARATQDSTSDQKDFIVDGLFTPGLNLFAEPKKHGKSMLSLNLALCISGGMDFWGRKTEHGEVLYMCLEDTEKRIRDRMDAMLDDSDAPEKLYFTYSVDCRGSDLREGLGLYLQERPDTKAVIIDVLQKVRAGKPASQSEYAYDYDEIGSLKELADKYGIALILVTHCRKTKDRNDWVNEIAGGVGVTGAADTILMLEKNRGKGSLDGRLLITGRDMPEDELALCFDPEHFKWHYVGTKEDQEAKKHGELYKSSPVARTVKLLLERNNGTWSGTSKEILDFGLKELGEPIAKNESALARKINRFDGLLLDDGITHTRPDPNGGVAGRIHQFKLEKPTQEAQPDEDYELPFDGESDEDYELPFDGQADEDYELPFDWKPDEEGDLPFDGESEVDGELPFY